MTYNWSDLLEFAGIGFFTGVFFWAMFLGFRFLLRAPSIMLGDSNVF